MLFDASLPPMEDEMDFPPEPERVIYGLVDVELGIVPTLPYPINIYNVTGDSVSGIAGTLYPNGTFKPLPVEPAPQPTRWWDDSLAKFIYGECSWNGNVAGGILIGNPGEPHRRLYDGTLLGDWPLNPPRPERLVNPEKARLAAALRAMEEEEE